MEDQELKSALIEMAKSQKRSVSLSANFWRGVVYGFGFFIGSAILAASLLYLLSHIGLEGNNFFSKAVKNVVEAVDKYR